MIGRRRGAGASGALELQQFGQTFAILVSAGELLGFDDVVQRGEQHRDRPDLVADRPTQQVGVLVTSTVAVPELHEQIQRTASVIHVDDPNVARVSASSWTGNWRASSSVIPPTRNRALR
jgi:hypothetical protein